MKTEETNPITVAIRSELIKADAKYPRMDGQVEGLHTIKCELAELEREIMRSGDDQVALRKEAIQVAAMAVKFLRDCCGMDNAESEVVETWDNRRIPHTMRPEPKASPVKCVGGSQDLGLNLHRDQDKKVQEGKFNGLSLRGQDWQEFSAKVLNHIEEYTVPQYGDKGEDRASEYTLETIAEHIGRYRDRIGSNSRGSIEAKRDMLKIAHYASLGYCIVRNPNTWHTPK